MLKEISMIGYLNITGLEVGLLLNFKNARLEWKRVVNENRKKSKLTPILSQYPRYPRNPRSSLMLLCFYRGLRARHGFFGLLICEIRVIGRQGYAS